MTQSIKKACLFNFIVYAPLKDRIESILKFVKIISKRFPCRLIFIAIDDSIPEIQTTTTSLTFSEVLSFPDQIYIKSPSTLLDKVSFFILPSLIPDLPVYLLWGSDPTKDATLLPNFQSIASRLIFDASLTEDWSGFGKRMLKKFSTVSYDMMDISWALISGWRDSLARLFSDSTSINMLRSCKRISILCHDKTEYSTGIYLLSWLASQLEWSLTDTKHQENTFEINYEYEKNNIKATISEQTSIYSQEEKGIYSVEITTENNAIYQISHRPLQRTIVTHIIHPDRCDLPITLPFIGSNHSFSFMRELLHQRCGEHYQNMLKSLIEFSKEKLCKDSMKKEILL